MIDMTFRTLDLNLLRVFDVVMVERNLTRAAERLALTQPAVSSALQRLRESTNAECSSPVRPALRRQPMPRRCGPWCAQRWRGCGPATKSHAILRARRVTPAACDRGLAGSLTA